MANKLKQFGQLFLASLLIAIPLLSRTAYAASATLSLSPASGTVYQGNTQTLSVYENSGGEPVNAVEVYLSYPAAKFTWLSTTFSSAFNITAQNSGGGGSVHFAGGTTSAVTGSHMVASVKFKALTNTGTAAVSFASGNSVVSANSNTNILAGSSGGNYSFATAPAPPPAAPKDTTAPTITKVTATTVTFNSATIIWTTSEPASSEVDYGLNKNYGLTAIDPALATDHKVILSTSLLTPATTFHYLVKGGDAAGNVASSPDATFTTTGVALPVKVIDQKNQAVKGAVVAIAGKSATTDSSGQATVAGLPVGKQTATITYKGKQTVLSTEVMNVNSKGKADPVVLKIQVSSNLPVIIGGVVLALAILGGLIWVLKNRGKPSGSPPQVPPSSPIAQNDPSSGNQLPPSTVITPNQPPPA